MKKPKTLYVSLCLTIAVAVAIFYFSSQPATESGEVSTGVLNALLNFLDVPCEAAEMSLWEHYVRKTAHFTLYFLLGTGLTGCLRHQKRLPVIPVAVALGALYAAGDEFHQLFVSGRSGQVSDVLLDTCGVATGTLVLTLLCFLWWKRKQHHSS